MSQRLRLRERKATVQGNQVSAMGEVISGSQPKQQQGPRGPDDRGRQSRDTTNNDVDRRIPRPLPWTLPQFRLQIRREDGSVAGHHRRQGITMVLTFPVSSWEIKRLWVPVFIMIYTLHRVHSLPTPEFGVLHQFTTYDCERPTAVEALKLPSHCLAHKMDDDKPDTKTNLTLTDNQPYQLLQKATYHEFDAHMCKQSHSKLFCSCMWASHSVINVAPQTD